MNLQAHVTKGLSNFMGGNMLKEFVCLTRFPMEMGKEDTISFLAATVAKRTK